MENNKIKVVNVETDKTLANKGRVDVKLLGVGALSCIIVVGIASLVGNNKKDNTPIVENNRNANPSIESEIDVVVSDNTISVSDNVVSENSILIGSFVDNHNQELYIAGLEEAMAIDNAQPTTNNNRNNQSFSSRNTNSNNTVPSDTTVTNTPDGNNFINGVIVNGGENVTVNQNNNTIINENNGYQSDFDFSQGQGSLEIPDVIEDPVEVNEEELVYEGVVLHKLNYEENGMWYAFYESNGTINANVEDVSMLDSSSLNPKNSNIYGISYTGVIPGWEYVCENDREHQDLGLAVDYEVICDGLVTMYNNAISSGEFEVEEGTELRK